MIIPKAKVNTREMKDKICSMNISQFNKDTDDILQEIEEMSSLILVEDESHQDFEIDLLNALKIV